MVFILGHGPHRLAPPGFLDGKMEPGHHHNRQNKDEEMKPGEIDPAKADGRFFKIGGQSFLGERLGPGTPDDHGQVLQENRHSNGGDQRGQTG